MSKNIKFGEIDWNAASAETSNNKMSSKDLYMRMVEGKNVVRVMGNPIQFYVHWVETAQGKRKFVCPIESPALVSRLEDSGYRRQRKWMIKVLDRNTETFKIAEIGSQIFNGIKALVDDPNWGKVSAFDITINRGPKGSNPLYSVTPNPHKKLDSKYKDLYAEFNANLDIERLVKPADPEKVCEVMGWDPSPYVTADTSSSESGMDDSDFDFDFD